MVITDEHRKQYEEIVAQVGDDQLMIDTVYSGAVQQLAESTMMSSMENGGDRNTMDDLHSDVLVLKELLELTADVFGKTVQQVEEDMIDVLDRLPIEELAQSRMVAAEGMLN